MKKLFLLFLLASGVSMFAQEQSTTDKKKVANYLENKKANISLSRTLASNISAKKATLIGVQLKLTDHLYGGFAYNIDQKWDIENYELVNKLDKTQSLYFNPIRRGGLDAYQFQLSYYHTSGFKIGAFHQFNYTYQLYGVETVNQSGKKPIELYSIFRATGLQIGFLLPLNDLFCVELEASPFYYETIERNYVKEKGYSTSDENGFGYHLTLALRFFL